MFIKRLFIQPEDVQGNRIRLTGDSYHYLKNVLRARPGDSVKAVISGSRTVYGGIIEHIDASSLDIAITGSEENAPCKPFRLSLIQALPKGKKMDFIIQKCTEVGVDAFYPLMSSRSIPDISEKKDKKVSRWQKIAEEAAKQAQRDEIPMVAEPVTISALEQVYRDHGCNLVLWEKEQATSLKEVLQSREVASVSITVGPEGGFEESEIGQLTRIGGIPVTAGATIFRTETAALAVSAMILYELAL